MENRMFEKPEETLDPIDWEEMISLAHKMVDEMFGYLKTIKERPAWQPVPKRVKSFFNQPLPVKGEKPEVIYNEFVEYLLPYPKGNIHPRFWGWVEGSGTAIGMLAEMLTATLNSNLAFGDHGAMYVEEQAIDWCKEIVGFPQNSSGLLVTGGSMANLLGLTVARNIHGPVNIREQGVIDVNKRMTVYCSKETHNSVEKTVEMLGLGRDSLRYVSVGEGFRIDLSLLERLIDEDIQRGWIPFCVIGNAGTVNTGAFDPLDEIADLCKKRKLWFHVDGAFGALINLLPEMNHLVKGMERADSLAFDLHKWLHIPYDTGCILVKNRSHVSETFSAEADYLLKHPRGLAAGPPPFKDRGPELSKSLRGLKVWMSLKEHGIEKFSRLIRQNLEQAHYLNELVSGSEELQMATPVVSNVVCFRYFDENIDPQSLDILNKEILMLLHEKGVAIPSYTILRGKYYIRVAITNHRSRYKDFDILVKGVEEIGRTIKGSVDSECPEVF